MLKDKYNVYYYYELIREEREMKKRQVQVSKMAPAPADSVFEHAKVKKEKSKEIIFFKVTPFNRLRLNLNLF